MKPVYFSLACGCILAALLTTPWMLLPAVGLFLASLMPPQAQAPEPRRYDLLFIPGPNKWMVRNSYGFYLRSSLNGVWTWDDYAPVAEVFDTEEAARTALEDAKAQKELL